MHALNIRPATIEDIPQILEFIIELATYEKEPDKVVTDKSQLRKTLFTDNPSAYALICEHNDIAIGFAVYFLNYSTWLGKYGIYLEDLYVSPEHRGHGAGKALLQSLAKIAHANDYGRIEWSVLNWNTPAIDFYTALGAKPQDEWTVYRMTGDALRDFAKQ